MKRLFLLSLVAVFCPSVIFSQQVITLDQAVQTAINNNTTIDILQNNVEIQNYNIRNVRGDLFPTLNLSGNWTRNNSISNTGTTTINGVPVPTSSNRNSNNFSLSLNSNVILYNGFANFDLVELETENQTILRYNLETQRNDVIIQVNRNFFEVLKKEQIVLANEENLEDATAQLNRIQEIFNVGRGTIADVYKQDVQVAQTELALEQSKNDLRKAKVDLLTSMNDDVNKEITAQGQTVDPNMNVAELKLILDGTQNVDALVGQAVGNRYDYKATLQQIRTNRMRVDIAEKNLYFPTIAAFGSYNINGDRIGDITDNRVATYGISLSYPIFQGFNFDVNRQIAEVNVRQKSLELQQLELQIKSDIKKSVVDLETAYKQVEILDRSIRSAEQDKLLSEEQYRLGLGTLLDVQTATTRLNNLRIDRINAIYNFLIARRQLDYLTGRLR